MQDHIFTNPEGLKIKATPERWRWEAKYTDGTVFKQFADDFTFHQLKEIDQAQLMEFAMVNFETKQRVVVLFYPGQDKLIHFYRVTRSWQTNEIVSQVYIFGREFKIVGRVHKCLFVITPDDEVIFTDNLDRISIG
jgi:hypothetical protein